VEKSNASKARRIKKLKAHFLFFLNQQFITRSMRADRGSYFVTMYIQKETTWKRKGREERKEKKKVKWKNK